MLTEHEIMEITKPSPYASNSEGPVRRRGRGRAPSGMPRKIPIKNLVEKALEGQSYPIEYASTIKGGMKLVLEDHHYQYLFKREKYSIWQCSLRTLGCEAKAMTYKDRTYKLGRPHNHRTTAVDLTTTNEKILLNPESDEKLKSNTSSRIKSPESKSEEVVLNTTQDESMSAEDFKDKIKKRLQKALLGTDMSSV